MSSETRETNGISEVVQEVSFRLFDTDVRCYVLNNGTRIVDADDFAEMMMRMEAGAVSDENDITAFCAWRLGK